MRLRSALAAAPLLVAIACSDDPPAAPPGVADAPNPQLVGTDGCQAQEIVVLIATALPPADRGAAQRSFTRARLLDVGGDNEGAWPTYVALAEQTLDRARAGTLRNPPGPLTANSAAVRLIDLLYLCGGRPSVGDVIFDVIERARDVTFDVVLPGQPTQIVVPSKNFGIVDEEGGFFDEPALIIIERVADDPPFLPQEYTEYPPRYHVSVLPASAQTNFGRNPGPGDPTILVIICPRDPHPDLEDLAVLRIPDGFPADPAQLLDTQEVFGFGVTCTDPGSLPAARVGAAPSPGGRILAALRRGTATAVGWLAPQPLYAVDGGIGGRSFFLSSFVAVERPRGTTEPGDVVVVNDVNVLDNYGLQNADNRRFARNLVGFAGDGPRASATRVVFDRGRDAPCFVLLYEACRDQQQTLLTAEVTALGLSITRHDDVQSYADVPDDVKAIVLFNPRIAFTPADVAGLRAFVEEGGRLVVVGEHAEFYGPTGLQVENDLLAGLGSGLRVAAARIDCNANVLPASSISPHQTTAGVGSLNVACMGAVQPAGGDVATLRSIDGTRIVGGVTTVGTPPVVASRAAPVAPSLRRDGRAPAAPMPTVDSRGRPIAPR